MLAFKAQLEIIGINPFVFVPTEILAEIFKSSGKDKGAIPVSGTVNNKNYTQTLVRYKGDWRLYINTTMLPDSPKKIGMDILVTIQFDLNDRTLKPHPKLTKALNENKQAKKVFNNLSASKQKEIVRYISFLKSEESITKNIEKAIGFLTGKNRFIGQEKP
ncbi:MAG: YdeI/OmpD-associated family protein [Ferruginibacter sp.]